MPQRFRVDQRRWAVYLGLGFGFAVLGCRGQPAPIVPASATPVTRAQVAEWVAATAPESARLHRFRWLFRDDQSSAGGRGSARIAPPDSLRFDVVGPLGSGAAAAAVVGDSALWADPDDAVEKLVPNYPLMWAMFGIARMPAPGVELAGIVEPDMTAWRYVQGADTIEYARTGGSEPRLTTIVRRGGEIVGRTETTLGPDGLPRTARLTVPSVPARLDLTFVSSTRSEPFAAEIWAPRQP